jgi:putative membrane protein
MRAIRRIVSLGLLGSLLVIPASIPAVAQSGPPAKVTHRQSVQTELDPSGEAGTSRVYTQVSVEGSGSVDVALPNQATGNLRNLEGFGNPTVNGDTVTYSVDGNADGIGARTVADNTAEQPVDVAVVYELDGETIEPRNVVGESGTLTATYTVRNMTSMPEDITYFNGQGQAQTETVDVSVPMVGSLSATLDARFTDVTAPGAAVAGDGRGNTVINASLLLFAPLGSETAVATWTAEVTDAVVPPAKIQILPVNSRSFGSIRSGQDSFKGVSKGLTDLTNGALIVDGNAKLLADGAGQLFDGLKQLEDGAGALNAGLAGTAAPGARQLADGTGKAAGGASDLSKGLGDLADGAQKLSDGLGAARAGSGDLGAGLGDLAAGARRLSDGLSTARVGGGDLAAGLGQLSDGTERLDQGAGQLAAGALALNAGAGELATGAGQLSAGAAGVLGGLNQLKDSLNADDGLPSAIAGVTQLRAGVQGLVDGIGAPGTPGTLLFAQTRVAGGLSNAGCDLDDPTNTANPCGLLEVMGLLRAGIGSPTGTANPAGRTLLDGVLKLQLGVSNPNCVIANPSDPANPCGIRQGASAIQGGAGDLSTELAQARGALQAVLAGGHVDSGDVAGLTGTPPADAVVSSIVANIGDPAGPATGTALEGVARIQGGAGALVDGADQILAGLGTATTPGTLRAGIAQIEGTIASLQAAVGSPTTDQTLRFAIAGTIRGLDNPAAFAPSNAGFNPNCLSQGDAGWTAGLQPCGLKQGLLLLDGGLGQLGGGLTGALDGVNAGLGTPEDGATSLIGGASLVAGGSSALAAGANQLVSEGTTPLAAGAGELADGATQLRDGAEAAAAGAGALSSGLVQLEDGAGQLADGSIRAREGSQALAAGLVQLDDGAGQLADGSIRARDGSVELASGLGQLDDGANALADGLQDAADGSGQLAEGAGAAAEGGEKVADGTVALSEQGIGAIIEGATDAAGAPDLLYEHLRAADRRGQSPDALPYGTTERANTSAVFSYELAGLGADEGPSMPVQGALAMIGLALMGGLGLAVRGRVV